LVVRYTRNQNGTQRLGEFAEMGETQIPLVAEGFLHCTPRFLVLVHQEIEEI
jgi:hypothetical protein